VTSTLASCAGLLTLALVLLLGTLGSRPVRRTPPAAPDVPTPARRAASRRTPLVLAAALLTGVAAAAVGPFPVAIAGGAVVLVHRRRGRAASTARQRAVEAAVPDTVELLVLCIHAGCSPTQAVAALAARAPPALRPLFADVELGLHRGRSLAAALGALAPTGALGREVAAAIAAADRDGTELAPVLHRLAGEARAARRRLAEADARRLPVRLTFPLVSCTLPGFVLLAIAPAVLGALSTLRATAP
jgi:tight adherence protein C